MKKGIILAVLAASLYAVNAPLSKLLLEHLPPTLMAGFLYLGAGLGMGVIALLRMEKKEQTDREASRFTKAELPYTVAMVVLDIAAPICLMVGLRSTTSAGASLLNNFEIVATPLIALAVFPRQ